MTNSRSIRVLAAAVVALSVTLAVASTAVADVTLFNESGWRVDGVEDLSAAPFGFGSISVSTNGVAAGQFLDLKIFFDLGSNGVPQVFSVMGTGLLRPALPPGEFGAAHRIVGYWDCDTGTFLDTGISVLNIQIDSKKHNDLQMTGRLSNFSSVEAKDLALLFLPPTTDSVHVEISFKLSATRDFCVDKTHQVSNEAFRVARLVANYVSPQVHDSDVARYVG